MLGNPVMVTTQGLTILLLVLCITYITQTAPLNISFPDIQNQFTKEISDLLKEVKWGCTKETKCSEKIDLLKKFEEKEVKQGCFKGSKYYEISLISLKRLQRRNFMYGAVPREDSVMK